MVAEDTMRIHPKFSKPLIVHIDASDYQTSGVVSQEGKSAAYFSRKFNSAQKNKRQQNRRFWELWKRYNTFV